MKSNEITLEKKNSIATIKFNRPEAFNAVNTNAIKLFHDHVEQALGGVDFDFLQDVGTAETSGEV